MKRIFKDEGGHIRGGWVAAATLAGYLAATALGYLVLGLVYSAAIKLPLPEAITKLMDDTWWGLPLSGLINGLLVVGLVKGLLVATGSSFASVGLKKRQWKSIFHGFAFGVALIAMIVLPFYLSGGYRLHTQPFTTAALLSLTRYLFVYLLVGVTEELVFRGVIQSALSRQNKLAGFLATSVLFAVIHLFNGQYTLLSLPYLFMGGLLFSVMRLATNNLFYLFGFHWAWNWTLHLLGFGSKSPWLKTEVVKKTIWSGQMGPESGIWGITLLALAAGLYLYLYLARRQSKASANE